MNPNLNFGAQIQDMMADNDIFRLIASHGRQ